MKVLARLACFFCISSKKKEDIKKMSYKALYRKLRPLSFDMVKGQDNIVRALKNQVLNKKVSHAYIFSGTRGTGKTSMAKIMSRAVNCENLIGGNPCNVCETCLSILKETSINIVEIDAASNTGIDDIRQIKEQTKYPPTIGKYRVFIIDEVHMLSTQAFNGLLKMLEEPPSYVIFILATTELHKIPVTVLSRCQRYEFRRIELREIEEKIRETAKEENFEIEERAINYIAKLSDGAMRDALSLLEECISFLSDNKLSYELVLKVLGTSNNEEFSKLFRFIIDYNIVESLEKIDELLISGKDITQFVQGFLWYLRNLLILKTNENMKSLVNASNEDVNIMLENINLVSKETLMRFIKILSELNNNIRYSFDKRILFELCIIKLLNPETEDTNEAVLDRISRLEINIANNKEYLSSNIEEEIEKEEDKKVILPSASYDDLIQLRKDWNSILLEMYPSTSSLLRQAEVNANSKGEIEFVFKDLFLKNSINDSRIEEIKEVLETRYSKKFEIQLVHERINVKRQYIKDKEVEDNIDFPINKE